MYSEISSIKACRIAILVHRIIESIDNKFFALCVILYIATTNAMFPKIGPKASSQTLHRQ